MSMKELKDWRGKRADAGRIAQGLPKNNKFKGAAAAAKSDED
jgi:topoisomerase-4 subunit A